MDFKCCEDNEMKLLEVIEIDTNSEYDADGIYLQATDATKAQRLLKEIRSLLLIANQMTMKTRSGGDPSCLPWTERARASWSPYHPCPARPS